MDSHRDAWTQYLVKIVVIIPTMLMSAAASIDVEKKIKIIVILGTADSRRKRAQRIADRMSHITWHTHFLSVPV